jgi:hypothetical protein
MPKRTVRSWSTTVALSAALGVLTLAVPAIAGPPLLCHPFDIGDAASLPWDGSRAFWQGRADYRLENLVADTDALLTRSTPVIVRMETLRRAALYASADGEVAARLYGKLGDRLRASQKPGGRPDELALFDFGYLTETYRQIAELDRGVSEFRGRAPALRKVIGSTDGYALIKKTLGQPTTDPALEFAAALMTGRHDDGAFRVHADRARAGAGRDALLARNINHLS